MGSQVHEKLFFMMILVVSSSNSYIDAFGTTTTGLTAPFRAPVPYTIPNHQYSTSGSVDDGWYAVSSYMYKNVAMWLGALAEDHSQEPDGGYLIINVNHNFKGIIYDRLITGLCEGKELYFDAFAGNASDAQPPKLVLYIKSPDGLTTIAQSPITTLNAGGGGFVFKFQPLFLPDILLFVLLLIVRVKVGQVGMTL